MKVWRNNHWIHIYSLWSQTNSKLLRQLTDLEKPEKIQYINDHNSVNFTHIELKFAVILAETQHQFEVDVILHETA